MDNLLSSVEGTHNQTTKQKMEREPGSESKQGRTTTTGSARPGVEQGQRQQKGQGSDSKKKKKRGRRGQQGQGADLKKKKKRGRRGGTKPKEAAPQTDNQESTTTPPSGCGPGRSNTKKKKEKKQQSVSKSTTTSKLDWKSRKGQKSNGPTCIKVLVGVGQEEVEVLDEAVSLGKLILKYGTKTQMEEDEEHEFKAVQQTGDPVNRIAEYCEKYINAFLNTEGGTIYYGIEDDGTIRGLPLDRSTRDLIRRRIDNILQGEDPPIEPSLCKLNFVQVCVEYRKGTELLSGLRYVVEVVVGRGPASVYYTRARKAFVRRSGSISEMPKSLIDERRRLGRPKCQKQSRENSRQMGLKSLTSTSWDESQIQRGIGTSNSEARSPQQQRQQQIPGLNNLKNSTNEVAIMRPSIKNAVQFDSEPPGDVSFYSKIFGDAFAFTLIAAGGVAAAYFGIRRLCRK